MTRFLMKPTFHAVDAPVCVVRVENENGVSVGTVMREETILHTAEKSSYRYVVELLGKYQDRFGSIDHVNGYLAGVAAVLSDQADVRKARK